MQGLPFHQSSPTWGQLFAVQSKEGKTFLGGESVRKCLALNWELDLLQLFLEQGCMWPALPGSVQSLSASLNLAALCPSELQTWVSQFSWGSVGLWFTKRTIRKALVSFVLFILCTSRKPVHITSSYHHLIYQKYKIENPLCWKSWFDLTGRRALGFNNLKL